MAKTNLIKQLEVLVKKPDGSLEWLVLAAAEEGKTLRALNGNVILSFKHEAGEVQTTFNLSNFDGYSIVR